MRTVVRLAAMTLLTCVLMMGAGIDGKWNLTFETPIGIKENVWEFKTKGSEVVAKYSESEGEAKGTFENNMLSVSTEMYSPDAGYKATLTIKGKVEGDKITGEWSWDSYSGPLTAERAK